MRKGPYSSPLAKLRDRGLRASASPAVHVTDGDIYSGEITVTGAQLGDFAFASYTQDVKDVEVDANVTAANTVTYVFSNNSGSTVDMASGDIYVHVMERRT